METGAFVILGAGGFAREVFWHIRDTHFHHYPGIEPQFCFVDEITEQTALHLAGNAYPIISDWQFHKPFQKFTIGVGAPGLKEALVKKALAAGLEPNTTIVHPSATVQHANLGIGGIIAPGTRITTNVTIGNYVIANLNCTIGHDVIIGDFVTLNPGVHVSGNVHIGARTSLGTGAVVREKVKIGEDIVVGAQAALMADFKEAGRVLLGVPAKERSSK